MEINGFLFEPKTGSLAHIAGFRKIYYEVEIYLISER